MVDVTTGQSAETWERLYFAGYVVTTLGNGELRPDGMVWQLATVVMAFSGLGVIIAVLDDALTLLQHGVAPAQRLDPITLRASMGAVEVLLEALDTARIDPVDDPPSLDIVRGLDIPAVDDRCHADATEHLGNRRALLLAFVASDGWSWGS